MLWKSFIRFAGSGARNRDLRMDRAQFFPGRSKGVDNHLPCALGLPEPASVNLHNNPVKAGIISSPLINLRKIKSLPKSTVPWGGRASIVIRSAQPMTHTLPALGTVWGKAHTWPRSRGWMEGKSGGWEVSERGGVVGCYENLH